MTGKLLHIILILFIASALTGCVYEHFEDENPAGNGDRGERVSMLFHVNTMPGSPSQESPEKVKSLRIIVLNENSVECNRLITFTGGKTALSFEYDFQWFTQPGVKEVLVFANEESVGALTYTAELSAELPSSLTGLLEMFGEESDHEEGGDANLLRKALNCAVFNPQYDTEDPKSVYLPYTVSYSGINTQKATVTPVNVYLVPVATKFIFNFSNSRSNAVDINGISLSYTNSSNYLLAHVGEKDYTKTYNGNDIYWVDWLAEISNYSWGHLGFTDNEEFNKEAGWITDYTVPYYPQTYAPAVFVSAEKGNTFSVEAGTTKEGETEEEETIEPGIYTTPVFYIPESVNFERIGESDDEDDRTEQRFYLTLLMEDTAPNVTAPIFENIAVPNLKALFRNTYVIFNISFSEGDIEVYAGIAPWNQETVHGYVSEGNAPSNNPFKLGRKR